MSEPHCKNNCDMSTFPYKVTKKSVYGNGFQRCMSCVKSIQYSGLHCPCCNNNLRSRPRHGKYRKKILAEIKRN